MRNYSKGTQYIVLSKSSAMTHWVDNIFQSLEIDNHS